VHSAGVPGTGYIACTWPLGQCFGTMPKKPHQRRETPLRAANDNKPVRPSLRYVWSVYRAAARARWTGQVVASTADEAVEAAAVEFKTDAWKLIAVPRYEIA
jgi:hypothetical protein